MIRSFESVMNKKVQTHYNLKNVRSPKLSSRKVCINQNLSVKCESGHQEYSSPQHFLKCTLIESESILRVHPYIVPTNFGNAALFGPLNFL